MNIDDKDSDSIAENIENESADVNGQSTLFCSDCLYRLGDKSFQIELDRYDSLMSSSSHLMSCISIVSIALITAFGFSYHDIFPEYRFLPICFIALFILLTIALIFALCARIRFTYKEIVSPRTMSEHIKSHQNEFRREIEYAEFYCWTLEEPFQSIRKRNNLIATLITISLSILIATVAIVLAMLVMISGCYFS